MRGLVLTFLLLLTACAEVAVPPAAPPAPVEAAAPAPDPAIRANAQRAARQFVRVVETMEPVAEAECRRRTPRRNCDFLIVVDDRPGQPPNAFQTLARDGRPILAFNLPLIASVRNADELAFVMGHEASHHILNHLARMRESANAGAVIFSGIAEITGADVRDVRNAAELGAAVGARTYSKDFELEADQLGTILTKRAGFDPLRGAAFFARIPDPGNRFLGSHPPNAERMEIVRRTVAAM